MREAREEISHWREFDHVVVNDRLDQAVDDVVSILHAARLVAKRRVGLEPFVGKMIGT
jgi:guanylate kinase